LEIEKDFRIKSRVGESEEYLLCKHQFNPNTLIITKQNGAVKHVSKGCVTLLRSPVKIMREPKEENRKYDYFLQAFMKT